MTDLCRNGFHRCDAVHPVSHRRCRLSVVSHHEDEKGREIHHAYGRNLSVKWVNTSTEGEGT
jgi:hypothetical protein